MSKREDDRRSKKKRDWRNLAAAAGKGRACKTLEPTVKTGFYCARNRNSKIRRLGNSQVVWLASQVTPEVKNLPANAGDTRDVGSIPGSGRSPGIGNGNPLQYSCLENSMDRGAHKVTKSQTWRSINLPSWCLALHISMVRAWVLSLVQELKSHKPCSKKKKKKKNKPTRRLTQNHVPEKWQS